MAERYEVRERICQVATARHSVTRARKRKSWLRRASRSPRRFANTPREEQVQREVINRWTWQDRFGLIQATRTTGAEQVLYCVGQTSVDENGSPLHEIEVTAVR